MGADRQAHPAFTARDKIRVVECTEAQQALHDLVASIPSGDWTSYGDLGEARAARCVIGPFANKGLDGRAAANLEESMRLRQVAAGSPEDTDRNETGEQALDRHGYPWWRVRNAKGFLVGGGRGRNGPVEDTNDDSIGNTRLRVEGCPVSGGRADPDRRADP